MFERATIKIEIGGPDDPFRDFSSTTSARARRHFDETGEPLVIETHGHLVIEFLQNNCVFTDSHYAGQPFVCMDWQKRMLLELCEVNPKTKLRIHRWGMIGIPKKNGKTELVAGLGNYFCVDDGEPSANVLAAASSDEQADLIFTAASRMVEWSPTLSLIAEVKGKKILYHDPESPDSQLVRVAAVAGTNDGKNVSVTLIDELHEWTQPKSRAVFTVLTQGGGARREPINIIITTAGSEEDSVCFELYELGKQIISGELIDDSFYFVWFEPSRSDCDHTDPAVWEEANPSWGLILQKEFYEDIITKRRESEFRRYFLNQWTEAEEIWEAALYWDDCAGKVELLEDRQTIIGVDIGRKHDSAAVVVVQYDSDKILQVHENIWTNPFAFIDPRHNKWTLSIMEVENYIEALYERFPEPSLPLGGDEDEVLWPGPGVLYDPFFFVRSAEVLEGRGLNMIEFPQTDNRMIPASQTLFELIKTQHLVHSGNPTMRRHVRSVVSKEKERGWRISKPTGSRKRVDGAIALAMASWVATSYFVEEDDVQLW